MGWFLRTVKYYSAVKDYVLWGKKRPEKLLIYLIDIVVPELLVAQQGVCPFCSKEFDNMSGLVSHLLRNQRCRNRFYGVVDDVIELYKYLRRHLKSNDRDTVYAVDKLIYYKKVRDLAKWIKSLTDYEVPVEQRPKRTLKKIRELLETNKGRLVLYTP